MKRLPLIAAGVALGIGVAGAAVVSSFVGTAKNGDNAEHGVPAPEPAAVAPDTAPEIQVAQSTTDDADASKSASDSEAKEEDTAMTEETSAAATRTPEEEAVFKQTMHEGDIALGVCGARVSALLWFYEASVAQGRDDLKSAVASLKESRETIKAEAERRAVEDKVDTSVRVMNDESEKMWNDLNEKAAGDADEFQKAHDTLHAGVQECLSMFFERPDDAKSE